MLLAVDVGNTQTVLGLYDGDRLRDNWRVATERTRTGDELGVLLGGMLDLDAVDGICLSSTVPSLVREWERLAERWAERADARRRARASRRGSRSATTTRARSGPTASSTRSPRRSGTARP